MAAMPRITAATVAEHRAQQHAALLKAARELLEQQGPSAVTPAAVGARVGLARSSVYDYFPATADILVALAQEAFSAWADTVRRATDAAEPGWDRLATYVGETIRLAAGGAHSVAMSLSGVGLPDAARERIRALHHELTAPAALALAELGLAGQGTYQQLVQALVDSATLQAAAGSDQEVLTRAVLGLLREGLPAR